MAYIRIIPSLLLSGNRLVKGRYFEDLKDAGSPATTIRAHNFQNADEVMLLDIDACRENRCPEFEKLEPLGYEAEMPLTIGGAVSSLEDAEVLFSSGADKIAIGSGLYRDVGLVGRISERFGSQAIVGCLDIIKTDDGYRPFDYLTRTTHDINWIDLAKRVVDAGVGEIRLMRADLEGSRAGMDSRAWLELREAITVPIILEGGASNLDDVLAVAQSGVDSLALGTMLVFSDNNIVQIKRHLKNAGVKVRL